MAVKLELELDLSKVKQQSQSISDILERALNKDTRSKALISLEKQIGDAQKRLASLQKDMTKELFSDKPVISMTKEFASLDKQFDQIRERIIQKVTEQIQGMKEAGFKEGLDFTKEGVFKSFMGGKEGIKLQEQLDAITAKMKEMKKEGTAFTIDTSGVEVLQGKIDDTKEKIQDLYLQYVRIQNSGNPVQSALQPLINFNQTVRETSSALQQAFGPYLQAATTAVHLLAEALQAVLKVLKAIGEAAISAFKPLLSLAQGAASAIGKMFNSIRKHNETTMKNLWRNVLRYGIGVRSMYFLIRKIRAAIGDVINELSKQIPEVNAQMSAFKTAVNGLKGALATAFQPILTAILPALTALINAVSRAIAVVGKFIALLTGQSFVYAATATQVDYAKSLDKTGKSAKKAKKELEGYLSPIDEINKYQTKNNDDNSGGGGGDAAPYTLKKVPIEDWIKDLWDRIRKAWQNADFFELGKMLGDKIAKALASIPWDKIKNEARRLGKSLATFLNGVMYGEFDGKSLGYWIGRTFAEAINTGFEFANQFVKNFDWKKLGQTIVDAIKGVFENLDWNVITETFGELGKGIGETIAKIFADPDIFNEMGDALGRLVNALVDMIYNFFNQQSGIDIGLAIARFINSAVDQFDPNDFAAMCNKIMEVILNTLITATRVTKWDQVGEKIAEFINGIDFKMIFGKYKDLANNIIDGILDMLESFLSTLSPDKIDEIGTSIAEFINGIDIQPERLADIVSGIFEAMLDIASTAAGKVDWVKIGDTVATFLGDIDWVSIIAGAAALKQKFEDAFKQLLIGLIPKLIEKAKELGKQLILGLVVGIAESIQQKITEIVYVFNLIINAIKKLFGIHSPSTVFMDIGRMIVEGFINGVKAIIDKAQAIWEKLKTDATEKFQAIKDKVVEKITNLKDKAIELYQNIKDRITEKVQELKTKVVELYEEIKTNVVEKVTALKDKAIEVYENLKTRLTTTVENIKSKVVSVWEDMKSSVTDIFEGMWKNIKSVINSILGGIEAMANGIISGLNKAIGAINNLDFDIPGWVPLVGGEHLGFSIPTMHEISLPRLAQGAVIPPNKEFMAVLGDQKNGTNIETPLSTMVEAFNQALRSSDVGGVKQINFLLPDRRTLAQYTIAGGRIIQTSTGRNPFELA